MKIADLIRRMCTSSGAERIVTEKANYLADKGYDVTLIAYEQGDNVPFYPIDQRIRMDDMKIPYFYYNDEGIIYLDYASAERFFEIK